MRCALHPDVETGLRCGKCDQPICPRCLVQTPVGARCPTCARMKKLPTYQVAPTHYLLAAAAGLPLGAAAGFLWAIILPLFGFLLFYASLAAPIAAGYLLSEAIGRIVNRKRGPGLAAIAAASLVVAFVVKEILWGLPLISGRVSSLDMLGLLALAGGIYIAVTRSR